MTVTGRIVDILALINLILSSAILITTFSLLAYILIYNLRSSVARAFCALLGCVMVVYLGDLLLFRVTELPIAERWLRFQWIGIAFAPAAYLHFSDALLRTTNLRSHWRHFFARASYGVSWLFLLGALFSDVVVYDGILTPRAPHLRAGSLFWLYLVYFVGSVVWGAFNLAWARRRCLTSTSRRRMTYLMISFAAPALGVFPYLLIISQPGPLLLEVFWLLLVIGNVGIGVMLVVMAYSVAYFGVLTPDRIVKHRLIHFLLRGPILASLVVGIIILLVRVEAYLGLRRDMLAMVGIVATIVLLQLFISLARPFLDRLIFWQERDELVRIQQLSDHLLTSSDLHQFLENILSAVCDLLRAPSAFIVVPSAKGPVLEAAVGSIASNVEHSTAPLAASLKEHDHSPDEMMPRRVNGYWVWSLRSEGEDGRVLGALAVSAPNELELLPGQVSGLTALIRQATIALQDRCLQQDVFAAVDRIVPELKTIQRQRGIVRYADSPAMAVLDTPVWEGPEFTTWVKDALSHYWGGPRLIQSPLLKLKVVEQALAESDGNPTRALRAVLLRAIEQQRPPGQRKMTASEWLMYNILELRFIQGHRIREIAGRLALSEADLYRKQRMAVEIVARALVEMEKQASQSSAQG